MRLCVALIVVSWWATGVLPALSAPKPQEKERPLLMETVGQLAVSQIYQGYLNVGLLADAKATGAYSEKDARQILESVVALLETSDKNLEKIGKLELAKEDRIALFKLRKLNSVVRRQAIILMDFWRNNNKDYSASYERLRKEAWDGISKMLNLNK